MANWLTTLGPFLSGSAKLAGVAVSAIPGGGLASTAMSLGAPLAASLLQAIVAAEQHHFAKVSIAVAAGGTPVTDTRKESVISNVMSSMPLIEALAAATGHPIPDKAAFEAALPETIDATIAALNAQAKLLAILGVKI